MEEKSAYLLSEVDVSGQEVRRLSAQARLFLDLELPLLLSKAPEKGLIADFGCGSGDIALALARARPQAQVWGLDADALSVEASQRACAGTPNLRFAAYAMGRQAAAPLSAVDLAFTRLVLLHLSDPVAALRDMASTLAPGGLVYAVETDDSMMSFDPPAPWQPRLLGLLEDVQKSRGGSRCRGRGLGEALALAGLQGELLATVWYRKRSLGPALFAELFLPVADFYLQQAVKAGLASADECAGLSRTLKAFISDPATEVAMALLHWSASLR